MPTYDAGEARGRVRIDGDARGVENVKRGLDGFRRAMESIRDKTASFNASLNRTESELRNLKRDLDEAKRAADGFHRSMDDVDIKTKRNSSSTKQWTADLEQLHSRLKGISEAGAFFGPIGLQVGRFAREMNNLRGTDMGTFQRLATSFFRVGVASTVLSIVRGRILGTGAALALAPQWAQRMVRFAASFQTLTFAVGILTRLDLVAKGWMRTAALIGTVSTRVGVGFIKMGEGIAKMVQPILPAVSWLGKLNNSLDNMAGGMIRTTIGMGLIRSGLQGLGRNFGLITGNIQTGNRYLDIFARALRFLLLPGVLLSGAALQGLGQILILTSNLLVGLWNGIKQLAGGLLAIPGAIAIVGAAAGTLKVIFSDLKDSFKSLIKDIGKGDMEKVAEDILKLPPYLRDLGNALVDVIPKWKDLQHTLTQTFIQGAADQLRVFTSAYVPALTIGGQRVANAWKIARERLGEFAGESRTVGAVNSIFGSTAQTMNSVSRAMVPALEGFRDLAVVGARFVSTFAADYLPGLAGKFDLWAKTISGSGRQMELMNNSVRGAKDLFHGLEDALKATWTVLTLFKTGTGQGFLAGFAAEMKKFNDAVQKSAQGGFLKKIGDDVRALGTDKLKELVAIFKELWPAVQAVVHMLSQAGNVMTTIMVPTIELMANLLTGLVQAFSALGGGPILGTILGIAAALKIWLAVLGPIINLIKIFAGIKAVWSGFETVILNMGTALERFGTVGAKAADKLVGMGGAIRGMAGAVTAVVAAIVIAYAEWQARNEYIANGNKEIADSARHAADGVNALRNAFAADQGQIGAHVTDQFRQNINQAFSDIESQAQKAPGIMDHFAEFFRVSAGNKSLNPFAESDAFNDMQKMFDHAKDVQAGLNQLKLSASDVADAITRGSPAIDHWANQLQGMGDSGKAAADWLEEQKRAFDNLARSAQEAGPGALLVAQGIKAIADAGGDASKKLEGLKLALQGLGLLQTDRLQAAFDFAEGVRNLGDAAQKAADGSQDLDNVINRSTGSFNVGTVAAKNLFDVLKPIAEEFLSAASKGEDVSGMWNRMSPELDKVANSFHITRDELNGLLAQMGGDPKVVSILVQLTGKDAVAQELGQILATAEANVGNGVEIPVSFPTEQAAKDAKQAMDAIFGPDSVIQRGANIFLKPGIDPAAIAKFEQELAEKYHIQVPGGPAVTPAPMPVAPTGPGLVPTPPAPAPPEIEKAPKGKEPPAAAPPALGTPPPALAPGAAPGAAPGEQHVKIVVDGLDQVAQIPVLIQAAMVASLPFIDSIRTAFAQVFADSLNIAHHFGDDLVAGFGTLQQQMHDAGAKMMAQLADGIRSGLPNVQDAVRVNAQAIADQLVHHSPPKKGPLSGGNWLYYSGQKATGDFAAGINSGAPGVAKAGSKVAQAFQGSVTPYGEFGGAADTSSNFLKQIKDILGFASNALQGISGFASSMFSFIKWAQDPLGALSETGKGGAEGGLKTAGKTQEKISLPGVESLGANPSRNDIVTAIVGESLKRGMSIGDATAIVADSMLESNINPGVTNAIGRHGLFQQDEGYPGRGTAAGQITGLLDRLQQGPKTGSIWDQIARVESGGYTGKDLQGRFGTQAKELIDSLNLNTKVGQTNVALGQGAYTTNPATGAPTGRPAGPPVNENAIRQWAQMLFGIPNSFGTGSWENATHPADKGWHGPGYAFDFHGTRQQMDAMANYIASNLAGQTLELIYQSPAFDPKNVIKNAQLGSAGVYGAATLGEHTDHVHWATDVAPILAQANATAMPAAAGLEAPASNVHQDEALKNIDDNTKHVSTQNDALLQGQSDQTQATQDNTEQQQQQNPVDIMSGIVSGASGVAGDFIKTFQDFIEAIGATKDLTDVLVRGPATTQDLMRMVDDAQKWITFAAQVASTVGDVAGMVGQIASAAGGPFGGAAGGGAQGVQAVAAMISAVLQFTNFAIDSAQEAWQIFGSYFGSFLGLLAGGPGGMMGDVKFLLDQNTGQLMAYSADNPMLKVSHPIPGAVHNPAANNQTIGQLNYYAGPGQDPRDSTRQMMFQVKASQMNTVTAQ